MAGVTPQGFDAKSLNDVLSELDDALRVSLGESIRLDARSVLGQIRGAVGVQLSDVWEALAEISAAWDPDQAVGVYLDAIVALSGVAARLDATPSTGTITISGTSSTVIPIGAQAKDADTGVIVETLEEAIIPISGSIDVSVQTVETGPLEAAAGAITTIVTPFAGWAGVTNAAALTPGRNIESDLELRARREASLQGTGTGTDGGLRAQLLELVEQAVVLSNRSNAVAADGTPPHAVRTVIYPDPGSATVEEAIARIIFEQLPTGIESYGTSTTATVIDTQGVNTTVAWDYATEVNIFMDVVLTLVPGGEVATADVQTALINYINGLTMGDDVCVLQLLTVIQGVSSDIKSVMFTLDVVGPPLAMTDIVIDIDEIPRTDAAKITVAI